jgi:hypothetical protein
MTDLHAWHLPALGTDDVERMDEKRHGDVRLLVPVLRPGVITRLAARVLDARREHLVQRSTADIIAVIDAAAERLTTGDMRALALRALPAISGFSPPMAARILDGMAGEWRAPALRALITAELGDGALLDGFVASGSRRVRAFGPPLITHIFSGNVPGVAVTSLVRALLVKSASLGKTAAGEPVLAPLFARAVTEVDEAIGACIAVTYWPGGESEQEAEALAVADAIVVYGGENVVAGVRARAPGSRRIIEHGPKLSFGIIGRDALHSHADAQDLAIAVARAAADFDQHGCVSPHTVFVQRGAVEPADFATLVAQALAHVGRTLPRGRVTAADAARIRDVATRAEFRGIAGSRTDVHHVEDALVIYDELPTLDASCLNRTLFIKPFDEPAQIIERITPYHDVLQSAAIAGFTATSAERLAADLAAAGVTRITDFQRLAWPAATWHHDGRGPLLELLRFIDFEPPATAIE